jgi:hypothetical protein
VTGRRALVLAAVAALIAAFSELVAGVAAAASVQSDDAITNHIPMVRLRLATLSQYSGSARLGLLLLIAAAAVVLLEERRDEVGTFLSTATFAVAAVYTALPLAGAANALAWFAGSGGDRAGAAISLLSIVPLSALACWLTAPRNLQRSR